jgi:FkbM family methyltransferase
MRIDSFGNFVVEYRENTTDEDVLEYSFERDIFFTGIPEFRPSEPDVIVDIGARIGTFALMAAAKVPRGAVYAVEACQDTFNYLHVSAAPNRLENLSVHHLAILDRPGTCNLYHSSANWDHSVVSRRSHLTEVVECCTLEQFVSDNNIRTCDFIKFNCEGAELPILLNSLATVLNRINKMLVLYHCDLWTSAQ